MENIPTVSSIRWFLNLFRTVYARSRNIPDPVPPSSDPTT